MVSNGSIRSDDLFLVILVASVSIAISFAVFLSCFSWLRYEQVRLQRKVLAALEKTESRGQTLLPVSQALGEQGELIAKFKLHRSKRVVSVLETNGKRFIHVDGELSTVEWDKMERYLKAEGFMS